MGAWEYFATARRFRTRQVRPVLLPLKAVLKIEP
jgi:hypothetical protein